MSQKIAGFFRVLVSKQRAFYALLMLILLAVMVALPAPASATQPEYIRFDLVMVYDVVKGDFIGNGTWTSEGVVESAGEGQEHGNHVGRSEIDWVRNVHTNGTLWDSSGTIDYIGHAINIQGFSPFSAGGTWTINGGSGAYTDLHGQGTAEVTGELIWPYFVVISKFEGSAHYEP